MLGKLNGINTGQKGLSRKQPQANESIDPEVSIFNGYREYLLSLSTMTTKGEGSRGAAVTNADQIGKMFIVVGQERQCLILDGLFTRRSAAEHANWSVIRDSRTTDFLIFLA